MEQVADITQQDPDAQHRVLQPLETTSHTSTHSINEMSHTVSINEKSQQGTTTHSEVYSHRLPRHLVLT